MVTDRKLPIKSLFPAAKFQSSLMTYLNQINSEVRLKWWVQEGKEGKHVIIS